METMHIGDLFLWIAIVLLAARAALLMERVGQPPVLGELLIGVLIGNLALIGFDFAQPILENEIIGFLAELGVVILLFQVGLESSIGEMRQVGLRAFLVASVGVVVPFVLGTYVVGPWLLPDLSFNAYLFLGATLTATSVGITARVFQDLGILNSQAAKIVLGAAVIDDVLGLIILAVVSAIVTAGSVSPVDIAWIIAKAVIFLAGAIVIGQIAAPLLGRGLSAIHTGRGMKFTAAIAFCLVMAYLAELIGLAPIIGAFAAGLVLDPVHFRHFNDPQIVDDVRDFAQGAPAPQKQKLLAIIDHHAQRHVEDLIEPLGWFLVPIFFVLTGMSVRLDILFDLQVLGIALAVALAAFIGKLVSGLVAGRVNKSIVGWGMVPRGEVGLIFAATGQSLGIVSDRLFSIIVIVVILSTLATPPVLTYLSRQARNSRAVPASG
jgi:Kef-type K+ transport system membrane component KefB